MSAFALPEEVAGLTIGALMRRRAAASPNRVALVGGSPIEGETRISYAQLVWRSQKLAAALSARGLKLGDRIGVMLSNDAAIEFATGMLAVHELGGVFLPINARFAPQEVVYVVNKSRCRAIVMMKDAADRLASVRGAMPSLDLVVTVSGVDDGSESDWRRLIEAGVPGSRTRAATRSDEAAEILFTSGTTAHPKGAVHTHQSALASAYSMADSFGLTVADTLETFTPVFTSGGVRIMMSAFWAGCSMVFDPLFVIDQIADRMERERTTCYVGASTFYIFLLDRTAERSFDFSNVRAFLFGGSPTTAEVIKRLNSGFPGIELKNQYAPTETGPAGTALAGQDLLDHPTSVGKPWRLVEVRIVDDDDNPVPANVRGEICTRGPCVMREYYGDPERSAEALKGGWHHTGDIGVLDDEGYLYIVDRKKDMVIRGGHNIASLEVEQVLTKHSSVAEAAVVGTPHPKLGEDIHAFILPRVGQTVTPEELRAFCKDKLADYKTPRRISIVTELPRGPLGKVLKSELRTIAAKMET